MNSRNAIMRPWATRCRCIIIAAVFHIIFQHFKNKISVPYHAFLYIRALFNASSLFRAQDMLVEDIILQINCKHDKLQFQEDATY